MNEFSRDLVPSLAAVGEELHQESGNGFSMSKSLIDLS